jgi:hypothetical protein
MDEIRQITGTESKRPRENLLSEVEQYSSILLNQAADFTNLIPDRKIATVYETGMTRRLKYVSFLVHELALGANRYLARGRKAMATNR